MSFQRVVKKIIEKIMGKAERILFILKQFNKQGTWTVKELAEQFDNEGIEVEAKSIQRDLRLMHDQGLISFYNKDGNMKVWELTESRKSVIPSVQLYKEDIISYHILKAHIGNFKSTPIEEGIIELEKKLEKLAPGNVFSSESLFWDKNIGQYDYTDDYFTIKRLISYISEKKWIRVKYDTSAKGEIKEFDCFPRTLFEFKGSLYVVVFTTGQYDEHRALLIQNIESCEEIVPINKKVAKFSFNKWSKKRFGVFYRKPQKVKLQINNSYVKYFKNRSWHSTQKTSIDEDGNYILEMKVPVAPDFLSWILSWHEAITVLEPNELKEEVIAHMKLALENYSE